MDIARADFRATQMAGKGTHCLIALANLCYHANQVPLANLVVAGKLIVLGKRALGKLAAHENDCPCKPGSYYTPA